MRPVIGILSVVNEERVASLYPTYAEAIEAAEGLPLLLPYVKEEATLLSFSELCDGFLFTGGADIDPKHYGEEPKPACGALQPYRDGLELRVFEKALATGKPIMGICRGAQLINVALGGTLYQDIPTEVETTLAHQQTSGMFEFSHAVKVYPASPLHALLNARRIPANSFHHQSIKELGRGLVPMAIADDGMLEAFYLQGEQYLRAYQWHPERLWHRCEHNKLLFDDFLAACKKR